MYEGKGIMKLKEKKYMVKFDMHKLSLIYWLKLIWEFVIFSNFKFIWSKFFILIQKLYLIKKYKYIKTL